MFTRPLKWFSLAVALTAFSSNIVSCHPVDANRYIPLRWTELHDSRLAECQLPGGAAFLGPLATRNPATWQTSEWVDWVVARINQVYAGTGVQFWLQSHDSYCTNNLTSLYRASNVDKTWAQTFGYGDVRDELQVLYPQSDLYDLTGDTLSRTDWLEKAFILYGDRHGKTVYFHNDFLPGGAGQTDNLPLPQHGYGPWYAPGVVFLFLSGPTWAPGWEFDPELTVAHEIGHSLGLCHTLDFEKFCVTQAGGGTGNAVFPDGSPYTWADNWDLTYINDNGTIKGFASRDQAVQWIQNHGTADLHRIDNRDNITLDQATGWMTAVLEGDPHKTFTSDSEVPTPDGGKIHLLQGLSFGFDFTQDKPVHTYSWQRNVMSYRYGAGSDPYDYETARFSPSQIETMQNQLSGSVAYGANSYGIHPAGTDALFGSLYQYLGDGTTEDFIWYSNGEGPGSVTKGDALQDMVAFRSAPAGTTGADANLRLIAGDFNGDGKTDLLWYGKNRLVRVLWSTVLNAGSVRGVQRFQAEEINSATRGTGTPADFNAVFAGDFDGNGADDLFLQRAGAAEAQIIFFKKDCQSASACQLRTANVPLEAIAGPVAVGNFDRAYGDDFVWGTTANGKTTAHLVWSGADGALTAPAAFPVGDAAYTPYAGNFNGNGGDDVLWYNPTSVQEVIWWGAKPMLTMLGKGGGQKFQCGPGGSQDCVDTTWDFVSFYPRVTVGDFDGNGADDILLQDTNEPHLYFSDRGDFTAYAGHNTLVQVALRRSYDYLTAVGEFDGLKDSTGRLGDDLFLYLRPQ
jgi:hypothetical protein